MVNKIIYFALCLNTFVSVSFFGVVKDCYIEDIEYARSKIELLEARIEGIKKDTTEVVPVLVKN